MNGTSTLVKSITAAGAIGLVLIMAFLLWDKDKRFASTVDNHIKHSTEAELQTAQAITSVSEVMRSTNSVLERFEVSLDGNTKALERLNYLLSE